MRIELGHGRSVEISTEQYLELLESDIKWERFLLNARGTEVNDPFYGSKIRIGTKEDMAEEDSEENFIIEEDFSEFMPDYD